MNTNDLNTALYEKIAQVIHIFQSQNRLTEGCSLTRVPFQSRKMEAKMVI